MKEADKNLDGAYHETDERKCATKATLAFCQNVNMPRRKVIRGAGNTCYQVSSDKSKGTAVSRRFAGDHPAPGTILKHRSSESGSSA